MLTAAIKAFAALGSPPFRAVLLKSIGLAVILLVLIGIGVQRALAWAVVSGGTWLERTFGGYHGLISLSEWMLEILAGLTVIVGLVFLMPAVTALVGSFFADEIADHVERIDYPADPPGHALPLAHAVFEGVKIALLSLVVYLCAVPFLLFAGIGAVIFFFATAFLLGREYFELAAMRFHPPTEAKRLRKQHGSAVLAAGMVIAAFVSVPILNLATPLFATAFMVHMHKRLSESPRRELIEPRRTGVKRV